MSVPLAVQLAPLALGAVGSLFRKKRRPRVEQYSTLAPGQQQLMDQILAASRGEDVGGPVGDVFRPIDEDRYRSLFEQSVAQPALQQFSEQTAPQLREEALGAGLASSSAGQDAISRQAGQLQQGLSQMLGSNLMGMQEDQRSQQRDLLTQILGMRTTGQMNIPGRRGGAESFLNQLLPAAGAEYGKYLGQNSGDIFGQIFKGFSGLFGGK